MSARAATVFTARSRYQRIALQQDHGGLLLTLNGWPQVHTSEERLYHEGVGTMPLLLARQARSVLILGGGDGLAARNALEFESVQRVTVVELDRVVIDLCSRLPAWTTVSRGALTDRRTTVVVGDAIAWLKRARGRFDVIIHDIEMLHTDQPSAITVERTVALFADTMAHLAPGGVWVLTIPHDTPTALCDGIFAAHRQRLPPAVQAAYGRARDVIAKTRVLLQTQFPHVRSWSQRLRRLGPHTHFYLSNRPLRRLQRPPPFPLLTSRPLSVLD